MKRKFFAIMLAFVMCFAVAGLCIGCASKTNDKTAYELWLEDGHSGTMDDFYNWLSERGEQGPAGEAGAAGVGIESAELNEEGKLVIKFTDGKSTTIAIPAGPQGEAGAPGAPGAPGADGADGNGIESIELEGSTIVITYTNGDTINLPYPTKECDHTEETMERVELVAHTQKEPGVNLYVCNECGFSSITRNETIHEMKEIVTKPTCTKEGFTVDTCTVCGFYNENDKHNIVPALDHDWKMGDEEGNGYFVAEPGKNVCEHGGFAVYVCGREDCDNKTQENNMSPAVSELTPVGPQGHKVANWSVSRPTANSTGTAIGACDVCGNQRVTIELPKLNATNYKMVVNRLEGVCTGKVQTTWNVWVEWKVDENGQLEYGFVTDEEVAVAKKLSKIEMKDDETIGSHYLSGVAMGDIIDPAELVRLGGSEFTTQKATCTETGRGKYVCDVCKEEVAIDTSTIPHDYTGVTIVPHDNHKPNCTESGLGTATCNVCHIEYDNVVIPATGHPSEKLDYKFIEEGEGANLKRYISIQCFVEGCIYNKAEKVELIEVLEEVESTCELAGHITYTYLDPATNKVKTHTLDFEKALHKGTKGYIDDKNGCLASELIANGGKEFATQKSNCGNNGYGQFKCTVCGEDVAVVTLATGEHVMDTEAADYVAPTCTTAGEGTCKVCGLDGGDAAPALGHAWKFEMVTEPTDDATGLVHVTCTRKGCEQDFGEFALPALTDEAYTAIKAGAERTCIAASVDTYIIKGTDSLDREVTYKFEIEAPALPHVLKGEEMGDSIDADKLLKLGGSEFKTQKATCAEDGRGKYICDNCKEEIAITTTGANRHDFGDEEPIETPATCTHEGSLEYHCVREGCPNPDDTAIIPALGHKYEFRIDEDPSFDHSFKAKVVCVREDAEGNACCDATDTHEWTEVTLPAVRYAEEGFYTEDVSKRVVATCGNAGHNVYTGKVKVTAEIAGEPVETEVPFVIDVVTPALDHGYTADTIFYSWTSVKTEKLPVYGADENGDPVLQGYKDVAVTYDYTGYLCEDCHTMRITNTVAHINGSAIVEGEDGKPVLADEASHKLEELAILKIVIEEPVLGEDGEPVLDEEGEEVTKLVAYELTACFDADCVIEGLGVGLVLIDTYEVPVEDEAPEVIA